MEGRRGKTESVSVQAVLDGRYKYEHKFNRVLNYNHIFSFVFRFLVCCLLVGWLATCIPD